MTLAQWKTGGFDADFVARELKKEIKPLPDGVTQYSGTAFFGEALTLLETGVEFLKPISDEDRSRIIRQALEAALRASDYGPKALIREINKATRDFTILPETKYIVATGLSFKHFRDITRIESPDCRLYVRRQLSQYLSKAHKEAKRRTATSVQGEYPNDYAAVWVHVRGRSVFEAMQRALKALDLRRGVWNFALNRAFGVPYPAPISGPLNAVLAGPVYSLHLPDGNLATHGDWFEPEYMGPNQSQKLEKRWHEVREDEEGIRACLKRSPYPATLEDALRRYCRALDSHEHSSSFLNLWSLLETLTGITPEDGHDKMVRRASFIYAEAQRKTHEQVLHHLRRYRNSYVHAGEGSDQAGAYLHQLRLYTERLLVFHFSNSHKFSSLEEVAHFLDLPADVGQIKNLIKTQERNALRAKERAHLAEEGLRFRESST